MLVALIDTFAIALWEGTIYLYSLRGAKWERTSHICSLHHNGTNRQCNASILIVGLQFMTIPSQLAKLNQGWVAQVG